MSFLPKPVHHWLLDKNLFGNFKSSIFKELVDKIPCPIFSINLYNFKITYLNDEIKTCFAFNENTESSLKSLVHPEDYDKLTGTLRKKLIEKVKNYSSSQLINVQLSFNFRLKNNKNEFVHCLNQSNIIKFDNKEQIFQIFGVITNINPLKKDNSIYFTLDEFDAESNLINTTVIKEYIKITKREKEIIDLLYTGISSKEISKKLNISINTVKIHRQNLLKKLNCKNTSELLVAVSKNLI